MDSPPTKRRKTSPLTHLSITPQDSQTRLGSHDGERRPKGRASFMSPTKASLARFNPSLLPPSNASDPERLRSQGTDSERYKTQGGTNGLTPQIHRAGDAERAGTTETTTVAALSANGQGLHAAPRRRSRTPRKDYTPLKDAQLLPFPNSRVSLPAESRAQDDGVHATSPKGQAPLPHPPFTGLQASTTNGALPASESPHLPSTPTHRGIPGQRSGMGFSEDGEPSLPSTPVHLGLTASAERPKGLLFSSPYRNSKRKEKTAKKSSPLKPSNNGPEPCVATSRSVPSSLGPPIYIPSIPQPPLTEQEAAQIRLKESLIVMEQQLQDIEDRLIRQTLLLKWHQEDSKESREIPKLQKDILTRSAKISRFRAETELAGTPESTVRGHQDNAGGTLSLSQVNRSTTIPLAKASLTNRLANFLPFGRPSPDELGSASFRTTETSPTAPFTVKLSGIDSPPPTHDHAFLLRRNLILSSPMEILQAKLQVTVDGTEQIVTGLNILEMSQWAHRELGTWFTLLNGNKDLSAIGAAFGHYHVVSNERAQCFQDSEQEFRALLANRTLATSVGHQDLIPYLGRQTLTFSREPVALDFSWLLSINDEGEVESLISAKASFPASWQRTEGGDQLANVGEAFDILVKDRGAKEAIRVVCRLIFPS